jgi:hypothetical protein
MKDLELAKQTLRSDSLAFAVVKDGEILHIGTRDGIGELIETFDNLGPNARGACLADRIVGKAVAMVARRAGLIAVYSPLASAAARDALALDNIPLECDHLVPLILNKRGDGTCPMERLTASIENPEQAVSALREFVRPKA